MEREYLTVKQAADIAHVVQHTIRRWMDEGQLTKYRAGRRVLVDAAELNSMIAPDAKPDTTDE